MKGIVDVIVRLIQAGRRVYARKWSFLGLFAIALFGSVGLLRELDLLPEPRSAPIVSSAVRVENSAPAIESQAPIGAELPTKIEIPKIGLIAAVANPTTLDVKVLDAELLKGSVRYPTSAKLGEEGNVVLFGHSSYLPVVSNAAYKSFNGIQKLVAGDVVTVYASGRVYTYRVRSVEKEKADDNTVIPLSVAGKVLTLVTCNSFGAKEDRFIVVADFVESNPIST